MKHPEDPASNGGQHGLPELPGFLKLGALREAVGRTHVQRSLWRRRSFWIALLCSAGSIVMFLVALERGRRGTGSAPGRAARYASRSRVGSDNRAGLPVINGVPLYPGLPRDEIRAIDHPVFAPSSASEASLSDEDLVVGVSFNGAARAYPLWILGTREIVNDRYGSDPVCVTFCTLSASAVVFLARVEGRELTFGNEGALYECNLVLYDRRTHSLWYQLRGSAIAGEHAGKRLPTIPTAVVRWADWRRCFPKSAVLVADQRTGRFFRTLTEDRAGHSREGFGPAAPVSRMDARLPLMQKVLGFCCDGRAVCLPGARIDQLPDGGMAIPSTGRSLTVRRRDGMVVVAGPDGAELTAIGAYWFAWHAAFPLTEVITNLAY